jgi:hypothetical protein
VAIFLEEVEQGHPILHLVVVVVVEASSAEPVYLGLNLQNREELAQQQNHPCQTVGPHQTLLDLLMTVPGSLQPTSEHGFNCIRFE